MPPASLAEIADGSRGLPSMAGGVSPAVAAGGMAGSMAIGVFAGAPSPACCVADSSANATCHAASAGGLSPAAEQPASKTAKRRQRRKLTEWKAQVFGEDMPGYEEDVGPRAATTEGRKERKWRAEARSLLEVAAGGGGEQEHPEFLRKRPAGMQLSHAAKAKACSSSSVA